tara:strand:- start:1052 stop:1210 length:159 start_codon:yes stop_codon:yes gene_type:complete
MSEVKLTIKNINDKYVVEWSVSSLFHRKWNRDCKKDAMETMETILKESANFI